MLFLSSAGGAASLDIHGSLEELPAFCELQKEPGDEEIEALPAATFEHAGEAIVACVLAVPGSFPPRKITETSRTFLILALANAARA